MNQIVGRAVWRGVVVGYGLGTCKATQIGVNTWTEQRAKPPEEPLKTDALIKRIVAVTLLPMAGAGAGGLLGALCRGVKILR